MSDFIRERYYLEVSSPGFDRPVRKPQDFERFTGERIKLQVNVPVAGRKQFKGELKGFRDGLVLMDCDGTPFEIHIENLKKAHLMR
jgi:ribosome maturation factor RimP